MKRQNQLVLVLYNRKFSVKTNSIFKLFDIPFKNIYEYILCMN